MEMYLDCKSNFGMSTFWSAAIAGIGEKLFWGVTAHRAEIGGQDRRQLTSRSEIRTPNSAAKLWHRTCPIKRSSPKRWSADV